MQLKLSFYDWCISILPSKKCQTPIILADLLGNESFLQRVQKVVVCDLWLVDFDPFYEFLCFKVRCLWSYCDQNPTLIFKIFVIDFIPGLQTSKFDEANILKIQINFWDRNSAIKCRVSEELSFPHAIHAMPWHWPRFVFLLALFTLARIACLLHICVKTSRFHHSIWAMPK